MPKAKWHLKKGQIQLNKAKFHFFKKSQNLSKFSTSWQHALVRFKLQLCHWLVFQFYDWLNFLGFWLGITRIRLSSFIKLHKKNRQRNFCHLMRKAKIKPKSQTFCQGQTRNKKPKSSYLAANAKLPTLIKIYSRPSHFRFPAPELTARKKVFEGPENDGHGSFVSRHFWLHTGFYWMSIIYRISDPTQWRGQPDYLVALCKFQIITIHCFRNWLFLQPMSTKYFA